jgi:hypothetical protein
MTDKEKTELAEIADRLDEIPIDSYAELTINIKMALDILQKYKDDSDSFEEAYILLRDSEKELDMRQHYWSSKNEATVIEKGAFFILLGMCTLTLRGIATQGNALE